jgi:broad-specificity NMP kinase
MIIEVTGVPGSGKSTIYSKITGGDFSNITFIQNKFNILNELFLFFFFFYKILQTYRYFAILILIFKTNNSFFHKVNILRNIMKKISKYMLYSNKKKIYLFDEGISHIPFNLFVDNSNSLLNRGEFIDIVQLLPKVDALFIINVKKDLAISRLKNRGHKRMNLENDKESEIFIEKSSEVIEMIKMYSINTEIIEIENSLDIVDAISQFEKKLKEINV